MAEKMYYSMGEVAEMLDVTPTLLRFWEKRFDIITPHKNRKGNRQFSPRDVQNLKTIYHLVKERGMTLAGAEKQLKVRRGDVERDMEIAERLGVIRTLLMEVRQELGGVGVIVDNTVAGEVAAAASEPVVGIAGVAASEAVAEVAASEPAPRAEPEPEAEPAPEPLPGSASRFVEQTLF